MPVDPDIAGQDRHYRRGLVLGLTMAEIMTLILFVLLLAAATALHLRERRIAEIEQNRRELTIVLAKLREDNADMARLLAALAPTTGSGRQSIEDIYKEHTRQLAQIADLTTQVQALQSADKDLQSLKELKGTLEMAGVKAPLSSADIKQMAASVVQARTAAGVDPQQKLIRENMDLRGQVANLSRQLGNGRGLVYPPCWADEKGTIEYIFDTVLQDNGTVVVIDNALERRKADQALLPLKAAQFGTPLTRADFLRMFAPLARWASSQDPQCRFFVRVMDRTDVTNKPTYKDSLKAVEGIFYKLEVNG